MRGVLHRPGIRLSAFPWLVCWLLFAPHFHLHTLDPTEDAPPSERLVPHTILSPDLPGEYTHPAQTQELREHAPSYSETRILLFHEQDPQRKPSKLSLVSVQLEPYGPSVPRPSQAVQSRLIRPAAPGLPAGTRAPPIFS